MGKINIVFIASVFVILLYGCDKNEVILDTWQSNKNITFNSGLTYGIINDIDGNTYKTIQIGSQTWMAENLKTTKYRNGDIITNTTNDVNWNNSIAGSYCWYNNDSSQYKSNYGALYNWYAVNDGRKIAPVGWHIPTNSEIDALILYLGGSSFAGRKLKEVGLAHWSYEFVSSSNETGFTALPGGSRSSIFHQLGVYGSWWINSEVSNESALSFWMSCEGGSIFKESDSKKMGMSIRCIKD